VVEDIIKRDQLTCDELDVFHALVSWGKCQQTSDKPLIPTLARLIIFVRFPLIEAKNILTIVEPEKVVPIQQLLEAYRYASIKSADLKSSLTSPSTKSRAAIPEYPVFDPSTLQATVTISTDHRTVTKRGSTSHVVVLAKQGFCSGVHKWRIRTEGLAGNQWVSVGVAKQKTNRSVFADPNHWAVSSAGQVYIGSTTDQYNGTGTTIHNGQVVEVILNMHIPQIEVKNLYSNQSTIVPVPTGGELFPAIGLHTLGNRVSFCDFSPVQ